MCVCDGYINEVPTSYRHSSSFPQLGEQLCNFAVTGPQLSLFIVALLLKGCVRSLACSASSCLTLLKCPLLSPCPSVLLSVTPRCRRLSGLSSSGQPLLLLLHLHHSPSLLPPTALCQPCCTGAALTSSPLTHPVAFPPPPPPPPTVIPGFFVHKYLSAYISWSFSIGLMLEEVCANCTPAEILLL